jgi:hypothetical protein
MRNQAEAAVVAKFTGLVETLSHGRASSIFSSLVSRRLQRYSYRFFFIYMPLQNAAFWRRKRVPSIATTLPLRNSPPASMSKKPPKNGTLARSTDKKP